MSRQDEKQSGDARFAAALTAALTFRGMSHVRLAELVGVVRTVVDDWCAARTLPSGESLDKLRGVVPGLPPVYVSRDWKPQGNTKGRPRLSGPRWARAVVEVLTAVGERAAAELRDARDYAVRHVDVRHPVHGDGQVLGREYTGSTLVMFRSRTMWLGEELFNAIRVSGAAEVTS